VPLYHELITQQHKGPERFSKRQELLRQIEAHTGRPLVVYAANMRVPNIPNSIDTSDITPFSELTRMIKGDSLDVLLHSPGGLAEAAERIVYLLRSRFKSVRFVIPHSAFSAATMLATSADCLVLDDTSALGPIDPQIVIRDPQTGQQMAVPTQAIMDGFRNAKDAVKQDPDTLGIYLPLLNKLDLHLFEICKNAEELSKSLVREWLKAYLLKGESDIEARAEEVTNYLSSQKDRLSHGRPITLGAIKEVLKIKNVLDLREDLILRPLITELWAEIEWFVENSNTVKFFENAYGVAFRRQFQIQQVGFQIPLMPMPPGTPPAPGATPQPGAYA
jgi:hypothetical protein